VSVQTLAVAAMGKDEAAFRALDRRLLGPMCGHFRKKLGADSAAHEELAREAISEAMQAVATGRYDPGKATFVTFLYAVANKVHLRYLRERGRSRERFTAMIEPNAFDAVACTTAAGIDLLLPLEQIDAMRDCIRSDRYAFSLTAEERFVILGRAMGKTFETLSEQLGRALDTVHRRSQRAIAKLQECMKSKGYFGD